MRRDPPHKNQGGWRLISVEMPVLLRASRIIGMRFCFLGFIRVVIRSLSVLIFI